LVQEAIVLQRDKVGGGIAMAKNEVDLSGIDVMQLQKLLTPRLTKYIPIKPTAKQTAALLMNDTREILYGGAAGGGKSVFQLAAALQFVDVPGYSAILFRKTYSDLSLPGALISMAKEWLMPFVETGEVKWSEKDKKFTFPSGATLSFGYLESDNDCYRYQGSEFHFIGMDECTHISPGNYRYLFSRLRKPKHLNVPLRFRATANPGGQFGEYYYQRFFVEGKERKRVFLSAGLNDNPHLDSEEYADTLQELDPITREQLLNGNWEIKEAGDMLSRTWFTLVPSSDMPDYVQRVRFWDMASTDPTKRKSKDKRDPDYTVGFKLAMYQGLYWIEDIVRVQKKPAEVEELVKLTAQMDGYSCAVRMEQEPGSSGDITIDHYARNVLQGYDFQGVRSTGSKVERARGASSAAQTGKVFMTSRCRNMLAFFDEADVFPYGVKDDTIDGFSGAFNYFRKPIIMSGPSSLRKKSGSYWSKIT
jgi:predicted phage terminase large subunit-like protein